MSNPLPWMEIVVALRGVLVFFLGIQRKLHQFTGPVMAPFDYPELTHHGGEETQSSLI